MKRSAAITLTLLTTVISANIACRQKPTRYCVDEKNQVVDDWDCKDQNHPTHSGLYHWYYGGRHGYVPIGTPLSGGSTVEPAEGFSTRVSTARGIFGGAGEAAAGHGGGGEGAGE